MLGSVLSLSDMAVYQERLGVFEPVYSRREVPGLNPLPGPTEHKILFLPLTFFPLRAFVDILRIVKLARLWIHLGHNALAAMKLALSQSITMCTTRYSSGIANISSPSRETESPTYGKIFKIYGLSKTHFPTSAHSSMTLPPAFIWHFHSSFPLISLMGILLQLRLKSGRRGRCRSSCILPEKTPQAQLLRHWID